MSAQEPTGFLARHGAKIDVAAKIGGICAIVFGVTQYSIETVRTNNKEARAASISYIERFADDAILEARLSLLEFWSDRSDLAQLAVSGAISADNFGFMLITELENARQTQIRLKRIGYFFDELYHCYASEICDATLVEDYFCPHAVGNEQSYFRFLRENDAAVFGRDLYSGVKEISDICLSKEDSL